MPSFLTEPVPHSEAAALIAGKPAVVREVFDGMLPEMKSRAFTITGIEDMDVLQSVRDQIAKIPEGAEWDGVKQDIIRKISPWLDEAQAATRAELLMRFHAGQAYATTQARIADAMIAEFPFRQYHTNQGPRVRDTHAALHGLILPADHEFWKTHTPPWEFNCHCYFTTLTEEDRDEAHAQEQGKPPEARNVLEGPALDALATGRISRGPAQNYTLGKSMFHVDATTLPYDQIKTRWDTQTAADFEEWASKQDMDGTSLLALLKGNAMFRENRMPGAGGTPSQLFIDTAKELATFDALSIGATPLSSGLSPGSKDALREWEEEHSRDSIEHGLLLSPDGKELGREVGKKGEVAIPKGKPTFGGIFSHSHPARYSLSGEDLELLYEYRLGEVRATTLQGFFSFSRNPRYGSMEILDRMEEISKDVDASIATLALSTGEKDRLLNHTVWAILAREGLLNYHFTPMRSKIITTEVLSATPMERPSWFERQGFAALRERIAANPEAYGEPTEAEIKVGMRLPKSEGGTLNP